MPIKIIKEDLVQKRIDSVKELEKNIDEILESLKLVPSYNGKAKLMDRLIDCHRAAQLLATNMEMDREYAKDSK